MGKKKLRGKTVRKQRAAAALAEEAPTTVKVPKSFVIKRGQTGKYVKHLVADLRRVMEPNTATALKARQDNSLKDFIAMAGPLGVSHMLVLTRSDLPALNLRLIRLPHGPTITFRVEEYVLCRDVVSSQKRPTEFQRQYLHGPLVIINNFSPMEKSEKLAQTMIQNMFPQINVNKANLNDIRRAVLWNKDPESGLIEFRHYAIKAVPTGVSRPVKKLVTKKGIPDLSRYANVEEFLTRPGELSESEGEELGDGSNEVTLGQGLSSKGLKAPDSTAALHLSELGPRLKLRLLKIEAGIDDGEVLYHSIFPEKSPEELVQQVKALKKKNSVKIQRRKEQEANVERKRREREAHKKRCLKGMRSEESGGRGFDEEEEEEEEGQGRPGEDLLAMDPVQGFKSAAKRDPSLNDRRPDAPKAKRDKDPTRKRKFALAFDDSASSKPKVIVARKKMPNASSEGKKKMKIKQPRK